MRRGSQGSGEDRKMVGIVAIILLSFAILCLSRVPLTMLTDPKAKCLDGSQAGFYAQPARNETEEHKWVILLGGGGVCASEQICLSRANMSLGSSKHLQNFTDATGWHGASDHCPINPDFCNWNHVLVPYCSQDAHSGQKTVATNSTWGLYFSGHLILKAILDNLDRRPHNLWQATEIIVQGTSAGGIGVWMNLDYIAKRYPHTRVTGVSIAGFNFFAHYYTGTNATNATWLTDFRESGIDTSYNLYHAFVDESCREAYRKLGKSPSACMLSNNSFPYIESETFVVQSQTDDITLTGHDNFPGTYRNQSEEQAFMHQFQRNMTIALAPLMKKDNPRNGVFAAACYTHLGFGHKAPLIKNTTYIQALGNFYFQRTSPEFYKLSDDCGLDCNPTCKNHG